ncbi:MAG: hypothetical protein AB8H86_31140 [Polyangiales bacterium]
MDGLAVVSDGAIPLPAEWRELVPGQSVPWADTGLWFQAAEQNDFPMRRRNLPYRTVYQVLQTERGTALAKICDGPLKPNVGERRIILHGGCFPDYVGIARWIVDQYSSASRQIAECDIAVDFDVAFSQVLSFVLNKKRFVRTDVFRHDDGKPDYRRHGSPDGTHFVVYDKRLERSRKNRALPPSYDDWRDVLRCEYRLPLKQPTDCLVTLGPLVREDFNELQLLSLGRAANTWTPREQCLLRAVWEMGTERRRPSLKQYQKRREQRSRKRGRKRKYLVEDAFIDCALASRRGATRAIKFARYVHSELHDRLEQLPNMMAPLGDWLASPNGFWASLLLPTLAYVTGLPIPA